MLRETRERIVARVKIVRKSLALERASGFAFSYHKQKNLNNNKKELEVLGYEKITKVFSFFPLSLSLSLSLSLL